MIKLLIADDEPIVIDSIRFVVEKYVDGVEVAGSARSGKEAIERALQLKPDVLFMDIHMPGINGIEAIRHLQERGSDIIFVIITAYEYFQYAREAVELGVSEYLLKPINRHSIIETLQKVSSIIRTKRERIKRETALMEQIGRIQPHMEGQFIYSRLCNSDLPEELGFYEDIFEMKLAKGYAMVAFLDCPGTANREESLMKSLKSREAFERFSIALKSAIPCLIGLPLMDRIVAYIPEGDFTGAEETRKCALEIAQRVVQKTGCECRIGIGRKYSLDHFTETYREASTAACAGGGLITHYEDLRPREPEPEPYPRGREEAILHRLTLGDSRGALEQFEVLFAWLNSNHGRDLIRIKAKLIALYLLTRQVIPGGGNGRGEGESELLYGLLKAGSITGLKIDFANYLRGFLEEFQQYRERDLQGVVLKATQFIEQNYRGDITLDEVARHVNMSYHYFSKIFKDTTGINFVDYLTGLRIKKAQRFLQETALSIKAISREVGYSDPNYFSKIFKKFTGLTPTEYRRSAPAKEVDQLP